MVAANIICLFICMYCALDIAEDQGPFWLFLLCVVGVILNILAITFNIAGI